MKIFWREQMLCLIVFTLIFGSIAGIGSVTAHAAIKKSIRSIKVTQQGKNITKKTIKMKAGATRTLRVKTKPSLSKRNIKFKSTQKKSYPLIKMVRLQQKNLVLLELRLLCQKRVIGRKQHG